MGRLKIPRHRVDKQPEFIPINDDAWDFDKIREEVEELKGEDGEADRDAQMEHAFFLYHRGETRCDLDAVSAEGRSAREYLLLDAEPEAWLLRRLQMQEWYDVRGALVSSGDSAKAALMACRLGVVGNRGYTGPKLKGLEKNGALSKSDMQILWELDPGVIGKTDICGVLWSIAGLDSLPVQLGNAVINASAPPTLAEKKASAS
jgi:hypothetical protein